MAWASLAPVRGQKQGGHRPVVVVASQRYLETLTELAMILPVTTVDRGWPNHVSLTGRVGLAEPSWAMTEQVRTISRTRLTSISGHVDDRCLRDIRVWLSDFLELSTSR